MSALLNLSPTITPAEFFEEVLLDELGQLDVPADTCREPAQFNVLGAGVWTIGIDDEGVYVDAKAAPSPPIQLSMSEEDWRAVVAGPVKERLQRSGAASLFNPKAMRHFFLSETKVSTLRMFPGDLQMRIDDQDEAATYAFTLTLGGAKPNVDKPTTTLTVQMSDVEEMLKGKSNPQQLFMQGKLRIDGDMNLVMGLMSVAMAP